MEGLGMLALENPVKTHPTHHDRTQETHSDPVGLSVAPWRRKGSMTGPNKGCCSLGLSGFGGFLGV